MASGLDLLISQQGRAFAVFVNNGAAREGIAVAEETGHADCEGEDEEESADGEGEDPLELEDVGLGEELAHAGCWVQC